MPSIMEQIENPVLRRAEIARLTAEIERSRKEGCDLDAQSYEGWLKRLTDAEAGIVRCYECGRIKSGRKAAFSATNSLDKSS